MFGYIKPFIPELKVREYELYNAVYCGLCKSMGRTTSFYSRLSLSYDAVFLALVLSSLSDQPFETYKGRCGLNPFRKKLIAKDNGILKYSAAVSAQMTYYSVLDRAKDDRGVKKLAAKLLLPAAKRMYGRSFRVYAFDPAVPDGILEKIHGLEEDRSPSLDRLSELSGELLAYYFKCGAPDGKTDAAGEIGRCTGRYVYIADACDDREKDLKTGAYNPLRYGEGDMKLKLKSAFGAMCISADKAAGELALEGSEGYAADIADNILRLGMVDTAKKVTEPEKGRNHGNNGKRSV